VISELGLILKLKITVNMASTKYEVEKFNSNNNLSLYQRTMEDLLIKHVVYKASSGKAKKPQQTDDYKWEEMDAKAAIATRLNLLDEVIHNVIYEEKA
jgi:hypothetical protein